MVVFFSGKRSAKSNFATFVAGLCDFAWSLSAAAAVRTLLINKTGSSLSLSPLPLCPETHAHRPKNGYLPPSAGASVVRCQKRIPAPLIRRWRRRRRRRRRGDGRSFLSFVAAAAAVAVVAVALTGHLKRNFLFAVVFSSTNFLSNLPKILHENSSVFFLKV